MFDPCSRELLHQDYPAGLFEGAHAMVPPAPTTDTTKETLVCSGSASKNCRKADMLLADALIIAMIGFFELGSGFEQLWLSAISFGAEFHIMASTCVETLRSLYDSPFYVYPITFDIRSP